MVTYVFDSSAVLRYLHDEAGSNRVEELIRSRSPDFASLVIPAIQWGEIAGKIGKRDGPQAIPQNLKKLAGVGFETASVSPEHAVHAAMLRLEFRLPYADAILASFAIQLDQAVLVTADFDFKIIEHLLAIEFLSAKQAG